MRLSAGAAAEKVQDVPPLPGEALRFLARLEHEERDITLGPHLVFVEARVLLVVLAPEVGPLLPLGDPCSYRAPLAPDLDLGVPSAFRLSDQAGVRLWPALEPITTRFSPSMR